MPRLALTALAALTLAPPAHACPPIDNPDHVLDPGLRDDTVAPGAVTMRSIEVSRSDGGGACTVDCRGDLIILRPTATDDRTPADRLGYRLRLLGGELPRELGLPARPVRPQLGSDELWLLFDDDGAGFAFQLEVRAVDGNGNLGPPTVVDLVEVVPADGCATAGARGPAGLAVLALAGLAACRRRRPRR